ncbi:MAG: hypothetical protein LBK52_04845 [Deltaproteobacteria bacterium]|jgi:hypothetical protein|nr:hypothetical protein [Deltaproteobacteria bacterium]
MFKVWLIWPLLAGVLLSGCLPPNVLGPYLQGARQAEMENERDRLRRIDYDLNYFSATGDYRALCDAAMLGSLPAAGLLRRDGIGCQTYELEGKKFIRAVEL